MIPRWLKPLFSGSVMNISFLLASVSGLLVAWLMIETCLNQYACAYLERIDNSHSLLKYKIVLYSLQPDIDSSPAEVVWSISDISSVSEGIPSFRFYRMVKRLIATGDDTELREACAHKRLNRRSN